MSKYTPGPWEVKFNEWKNTIICKEDNCIAEVSLYGDCSEANARLIAAAPEMYEALKLFYKLHAEGKFTLEDKDYIAITQAAAVLAKVEGKEQNE